MTATATRTLYEIGDDLRAIEQLLIDAAGDGGDITDAEAQLDQWLAESEGNLKTKIDRYCALIREFEASAESRKAEAARLSALAKSDAGHAARLKSRLQWFFETQNLDKLKTDRFNVSLANHGGKLPLIVNVDGKTLPPRFQQVSIDPNKDAIREALESGEAVNGCQLGERGRSLRIR